MFRRLYALLVFTALAIPAAAQTPSEFTAVPSTGRNPRPIANEQHLQATSLGALYANSAFARGYRHGYDQGFHVGDLDVHMGREARVVMSFREYQQAGREYSGSFGSKQLFQEGYRAGFRGGYGDAITGMEYRVGERTKAAATGLNDVLPPSRRSYFDEGLAGGYKVAQTHNAPVERISATYLEQYCQKTASGSHPLEYCSGFSRGYVLGLFNVPSAAGKVASSETTGH